MSICPITSQSDCRLVQARTSSLQERLDLSMRLLRDFGFQSAHSAQPGVYKEPNVM